jgi:hypothetical protein
MVLPIRKILKVWRKNVALVQVFDFSLTVTGGGKSVVADFELE